MTPKTKTQNLSVWGAALGVSIILAFLTGIATHWPESGGIDWRGVWLDVIQVILSTAPVAAAGLGLPRLGRENIASLVSEVGSQRATDVLSVEAISQDTGTRIEKTLTDDDVTRITDRLLAETETRRIVATEGKG